MTSKQQTTPTPATTAPSQNHHSNPIYSYNHQNPHGPFAAGPVPKGIIIISAVLFVSTIVSFFSASAGQVSTASSFIAVIIGLVDLALIAGLLLRLEVARKTLIVFAGIVVVLMIVNAVLLSVVMNRLDTLNESATQKITELRAQPLSQIQQAQVQEFEDIVTDSRGKTLLIKKRLPMVYFYMGLTIAANAGGAIYLMRPEVKYQFRKLQG